MGAKVGYVVLYVKDPEASRAFWTERVGMTVKSEMAAGPFTIRKVGFADQDFAFELVPLEMMKDNPNGLTLGTPSICLYADDLHSFRAGLVARGVEATPIAEHFGRTSFAFSDGAGSYFAVLPKA